MLFTFHIVNLKLDTKDEVTERRKQFTFHIVNLKPQNKLGISNTYTYASLSNLQ
ncbi:hypothetical protein BN1095_960014 [Clostridioides difficile]|uniref:Uncharacterized protein n=1 Tax=Clostridioides difficile TaxID=1496 RepID=A0A069B291_CLODI|nr:hypothetical protein BN1096_470011 [Clostridioides difficile]CDS85277.1 conserved hypothetical protein [Clostridioides difficile]CDT82562.1 hypothetical protein BN1095_960014 [Clostridioides difficile]